MPIFDIFSPGLIIIIRLIFSKRLQDHAKGRYNKARRLAPRVAVKPEVEHALNASIMEIFALAKKELDRLRKKELTGSLQEK